MPSWHVQRQLYLYLGKTGGKFSITNKYFKAMDKSKLSESANRAVRLLKQSHISELWTICVRLESNTVITEEEVVKNLNWCRHYKESVRSLLGGYTECCRAQVTQPQLHPVPLKKEEGEEENSLYVSFCMNMMTHDPVCKIDTSN